MMEQIPVVSLVNIRKRFGHVEALRGATVEVCAGMATAIVGDNGSGKSTLIKILSGNLRPDAGEICIGGRSYPALTIHQSMKLGIRTVYQDLSLDNNKDCAGNIFLGEELTRGPFLCKKLMQEQARKLLESINVQIPDLTIPAGQLSGGQRQGLAIARALRSKARLIVLDEPTAAMGIQETHRAVELLKGLKRRNVSLLLVSHNLYQVFDLADRIFVMRAGKCIADVWTRDTTPEAIQHLILSRESEL